LKEIEIVMLKRERGLLSLALVVVLATSLIVGVCMKETDQVVRSDCSSSRTYDLSQHTAIEKIEIFSNEEFHTQASSYHWDGDGSEETPYIISNYILTADAQQPVFIWDVDLHWELRNCFIETGSVCGSSIVNVANGVIANCTFHYRWNGLVMENIENMVIEGNVMEDNGRYGISVTGTATNCVFKDNVIRRNDGYGLMVPIATNCQFIGNEISNNDGNGILVVSADMCEFKDNTVEEVSGNGFAVSTFDNGLIEGNSIVECGERGIYASAGENSIIKDNTVDNCTSYGIVLGSSSTGMAVRGNVLLNNGDDCQVCDDGTDNVIEYNYYDDWTSPDADLDEIVDDPYVIDGTATNEDPYPLANPDAEPSVTTSTSTTTTSTTTTTTTTTTTNTEIPSVPMEFILIGAAIPVVLIGVVLVVRMRK
jgi:parallel beta-helix repeat protein